MAVDVDVVQPRWELVPIGELGAPDGRLSPSVFLSVSVYVVLVEED